MKIKNGITPRRFWLPLWGYVRYTDHRDIAYHRTVGSVPIPLPTMEYNYDAGFGMPNQNYDGLPNACTGYDNTEVAQDFDHVQYNPAYTYGKTLEMQGLPAGSPCDMRKSLQSTIVYGVQKNDETTDVQAETHRQGPYLNVEQAPGMDWFDSLRSSLRKNPNRSLALATPWFQEWESTPSTGIVTSLFVIGDVNNQEWHAHKFCGEKVIDGVQYIYDKSWQGTGIGDGGWLYFDRATVNKVMAISGTEVFIRLPVGMLSAQTIKLDLLELALSYIGMYLARWGSA